MKAVDCQGLGGGMTLGMVQAGFDIVQKYEQPGGFGFAQHDSNRHLLGNYPMMASPAAEWEPRGAELVFGCPPCSGFSALSVRAGGRDMRGTEAAINSCMWDFWGYVARAMPYAAAMESVPAAGKAGKPLMDRLAAMLRETTGQRWFISHVFHNAISVGGCSMRKRYFLVASRLGPFGIETPRPVRVPTMRDAIGDLEHLPLTWDVQRMNHHPDDYPWAARKWTETRTVNGHALPEKGRWQDGIRGLAAVDWRQGEAMNEAVERYWRSHGGVIDENGAIVSDGEWPDGWTQTWKDAYCYRPVQKGIDWDAVKSGAMTEADYLAKWRAKQMTQSRPRAFIGDMYQPRRWRWDRCAYVLNGGSMSGVVHPTQPRTLTYREMARIMGFPDAWNVETYVGREQVFGKAVTVDVAYWLGYWLSEHLDGGHRSLWIGDPIGEDEYVIDCTNDYKAVYNDRTGAHEDSRSPALKKLMEARPA